MIVHEIVCETEQWEEELNLKYIGGNKEKNDYYSFTMAIIQHSIYVCTNGCKYGVMLHRIKYIA